MTRKVACIFVDENKQIKKTTTSTVQTVSNTDYGKDMKL